MSKPEKITRDWLEEDRILRNKVLESHYPDIINDDDRVYEHLMITYLIGINNELQYMNDAYDWAMDRDPDYKESKGGFTVKVGGTD